MTKWDQNPLTEEEKNKIRRDRAKGFTVADLVEKYRSSKGAIYRALSEKKGE